MKARLLAFILCLGFGPILKAQIPFQPTDSVAISLLTCAPGDALYSKFGHSAIRVKIPSNGLDIVYNYGLFDFRTPNFYTKFVRGKLLYQLGVQYFSDFLQEYEYEQRTVWETPLHLDSASRQQVLSFLDNNYRPENRKYPYDFFYDNCASRIRDVLEKSAAMAYMPGKNKAQQKTYRELLDEYIAPYPWIDFGIDLILGLPTDQQADFRAEMFLPNYLSKNITAGQVNTKPIAQPTTIIVPGAENQDIPKTIFTPLLVFSLLFLVFAALTWKASDRIKTVVDSVLFVSIGLSGILFTFMWLGTDHEATHRNLNLLWANPLAFAALAGTFSSRYTHWMKPVLFGALLVLVGYPFLPQHLHLAVLPISGIIALRTLDRLGYLHKFLAKK